MISEFEKERLEIYRKKVEGELRLKEKELELQQQEKTKANSKKLTLTGSQVTLIVAVIGVAGTYIGTLVEGYNTENIERLKFESDIILKVISEDDVAQSKENLKFLLDAGFIKSHEEELRKILKDTTFNVRIPNNTSSQVNVSFIRGIVLESDTQMPISNAEIIVKKYNTSGVTSEDGYFYIKGNFLEGEQIDVSITKEGYQTVTSRFRANQYVTHEIIMQRKK